MSRIDRRSGILEAIAQLVRLSAEGEYDQLIFRTDMGRAYLGMSSCKLVKGTVEPLYICGRDVDELNRELLKETRKRTGRGKLQYILIVHKYGKASADLKPFSPRQEYFLSGDYCRSLSRHNSKIGWTSGRGQIWRLRLSDVLVWPLLPKNRLSLGDFL